jgi:hypothetical protein
MDEMGRGIGDHEAIVIEEINQGTFTEADALIPLKRRIPAYTNINFTGPFGGGKFK